jgi:uncharacterized membrane protein YphA (DoxX/SURF4 family)
VKSRWRGSESAGSYSSSRRRSENGGIGEFGASKIQARTSLSLVSRTFKRGHREIGASRTRGQTSVVSMHRGSASEHHGSRREKGAEHERCRLLIGRILVALIFLMAGLNKVLDPGGTRMYMAAHGMPVTGLLLAGASIFELVGGLSVLLGLEGRCGAVALGVFLVPTSVIFHTQFSDPGQVIHFMKKLAILGGLLVIASCGMGEAQPRPGAEVMRYPLDVPGTPTEEEEGPMRTLTSGVAVLLTARVAALLMALFTVLVVVLVPVAALAQISFERTYGGPDWDGGWSVGETGDGGYIIAGWTGSFGAGSYDVYLIKTDSGGDTVWTRTYGGPSEDEAYSVGETSDGGYIIAGETHSFGAGSYDVYLIKTDSGGDTVWTRTYGGPDHDSGCSVRETSDGGYIIAGLTGSFGAGASDVYLIKTDSGGDTVWTRTYGGPDSDSGRSVRERSDGGYIIAGLTGSFGAGYSDVYLIKTDSGGDTVWTRTYGGPDSDQGRSVGERSDGGYIIAGLTESFGAGSWDVYLIKTDSGGDTVWTRTYGGPSEDEAYSVGETSDGGYIIAGWTRSFGAGSWDFYLIKTDSGGDTVWTRTYGGPSGDEAYSVGETSDGGYIIAGWTESFGAGYWDVYLIKTDADGFVQVTEGHEETPRPGSWYLSQNHPNPFGSATTITYALPDAQPVTLAIYDIRGALVRDLIRGTVSAGQHRVVWDGRDGRGHSVASGIYFCSMEAGGSRETRRMVLLR